LDAPASLYRTAVVARDPQVRSDLSALLLAYPGISVLGPLADAGIPQPEVVVWDTEGKQQDFPADTPVIALLPDETGLRDALKAGARGVLLRDAAGAALGSAVVAVLHGNRVLSPQLLDALLDERPRPRGPLPDLTPRESEVIALVAEGLSNRQIAARLGISEHTAKFHVNAILDKLGAETRTEAVVLAARSGLLAL
jgi:two-component system nitrate/nitrite response regulator NarL